MAEEDHVWEEIRDALNRLAEGQEKQTGLLEDMATGAKWGRFAAVLGVVVSGSIAGAAFVLGLSLAYGFEIPLESLAGLLAPTYGAFLIVSVLAAVFLWQVRPLWPR